MLMVCSKLSKNVLGTIFIDFKTYNSSFNSQWLDSIALFKILKGFKCHLNEFVRFQKDFGMVGF